MAKLKDLRNSKVDETEKISNGGRPPKDKQDRCSYLYAFRLNEEDNIAFERLFKESGASTKTQFITNCIFQRPFQMVVTDKGAMNISLKLIAIKAEIQKIGVNYDQVVKALKHAFTEKVALVYLYRLEKRTIELVTQLQKVTDLAEEYKRKWLQKENQ